MLAVSWLNPQQGVTWLAIRLFHKHTCAPKSSTNSRQNAHYINSTSPPSTVYNYGPRRPRQRVQYDDRVDPSIQRYSLETWLVNVLKQDVEEVADPFSGIISPKY